MGHKIDVSGPPTGVTVKNNDRLTDPELNEVECDFAKAAYNGTEPSNRDGKVPVEKLKDAACINSTEGLSEVEMEFVCRIKRHRQE